MDALSLSRLLRLLLLQSEAAETTEKFGLEAGLWKVWSDKSANGESKGQQVRGLRPSASISLLLTYAPCHHLTPTLPSPHACLPAPPPPTPPTGPQAKELLKRYGSAYLLTSISFALVSFAACYLAVSAGVDVAALLARLGLQARHPSCTSACARRLHARGPPPHLPHRTGTHPPPPQEFQTLAMLRMTPCRPPTRARRWARWPWPTQPTRPSPPCASRPPWR